MKERNQQRVGIKETESISSVPFSFRKRSKERKKRDKQRLKDKFKP